VNIDVGDLPPYKAHEIRQLYLYACGDFITTDHNRCDLTSRVVKLDETVDDVQKNAGVLL